MQLEEEEEAKFRRDVTDLSRRLAIEARDRELAQQLQEKEKARLRKAKEKARLKAQQKAAAEQAELLRQQQQQQQLEEEQGVVNRRELPAANSFVGDSAHNIAACIDPTWNRRYPGDLRHPIVANAPQPLPITDLGETFVSLSFVALICRSTFRPTLFHYTRSSFV